MGYGTFLILIFLTVVCARYTTFDELYATGVTAYDNSNWTAAIENIEMSLDSYKEYRGGLATCSQKCSNKLSDNEVVNKEHLGKMVFKGLCVRDCLDKKFGDFKLISRIDQSTVKEFEDLMPYHYLQYAYFQNGNIAESVSAAYTYNLRFPNDSVMSGNMEFFREREDITEDMFVDREAKEHLEKYDRGLQAYLKEDYESSIEFLEESLESYYDAVSSCYGVCESVEAFEEDQWKIDFHRQNAYHYVKVLECNLKCVRALSSNVHGQYYRNFIPLLYHYLQFAHYEMENYEEAAEYMVTYSLFHPSANDMKDKLEAVAGYLNISAIDPSKEAVQYLRRIKLEASMLEYSWDYFGMKSKNRQLIDYFMKQPEDEDEKDEAESDESKPVDQDEGYQSMKEKTDDIISNRAAEIELRTSRAVTSDNNEIEDDVDISDIIANSKTGFKVVDSKHIVSIVEKGDEEPIAEGPLLDQGVSLLANSTMLKGKERFALDGFSDGQECQDLIDLAIGFGKPGDGYFGEESPHTEHENFAGVSVLDAVLSAKAGNLPLAIAKLYYDLSEKVRAQAQAYFKLPRLFFDYTHLVCRTAKPDSNLERDDLSHPVHADNCLLKSNAECVKEPPAYIWRDYSAILYLNDDFDGGEFIFTDSTARRVRVNLKPKCGRLVSFGAGKESLHGVKPVIHGRRCAVALWFTMSEDKREKRRDQAKKILDELYKSSSIKDEL